MTFNRPQGPTSKYFYREMSNIYFDKKNVSFQLAYHNFLLYSIDIFIIIDVIIESEK